jgi:hypothetical protein
VRIGRSERRRKRERKRGVRAGLSSWISGVNRHIIPDRRLQNHDPGNEGGIDRRRVRKTGPNALAALLCTISRCAYHEIMIIQTKWIKKKASMDQD